MRKHTNLDKTVFLNCKTQMSGLKKEKDRKSAKVLGTKCGVGGGKLRLGGGGGKTSLPSSAQAHEPDWE